MKILVFSDSHSYLPFMRQCIEAVSPACILHLGDYFSDGATIARENPQVRFYQVPGNCDAFRCPTDEPEVLMPRIGGVNIFMTHGHLHRVKSHTALLLKDARKRKADIVLYDHTHIDECIQEPDGLWVMNPGSCGYFGTTAGLIEVENGKILRCQILRGRDLEGAL